MLKEGDKAPAFTLVESKGQEVHFQDFLGKNIVLYFYPRNNTPGCTTEACSFRDVYDDILAQGAVVIGVSPDTHTSHEKFKNKHGLPFYLLSDPEKEVAQKYGAFGEKKLYGKTSMGIIRSTFIIDREGIIKKVFPKVTPKGHGEVVLKALEELD